VPEPLAEAKKAVREEQDQKEDSGSHHTSKKPFAVCRVWSAGLVTSLPPLVEPRLSKILQDLQLNSAQPRNSSMSSTLKTREKPLTPVLLHSLMLEM
jgi:hypothetical protein